MDKQMVIRHGGPFPRRNCVDLYHPLEQRIRETAEAVEAAGAHAALTEALQLINAAQDKVADWVEGVSLAEEVRKELLRRIDNLDLLAFCKAVYGDGFTFVRSWEWDVFKLELRKALGVER